MPRTYNRWIFTRSCEFGPEGNLSLGQILAEPKDPAYVLQPFGPLAFPDLLKPEITSRENISIQDKSELSAQFNAWARLGYIPVQVKSNAAVSRAHDFVWHFDKLESRIISPDINYVEGAMRHGDVEASLRNFHFKRRVYMVTGVRIVSGARMRRENASSTSGGILAQGGPPDQSMEAGVRGQLTATSLDSEAFDKASDFVFAYRLNEVRYRGTVTHKPYTGGEAASADSSQAPEGNAIELADFEVLKMVDIPFSGGAGDFERVDVPDHDEMECFVLK